MDTWRRTCTPSSEPWGIASSPRRIATPNSWHGCGWVPRKVGRPISGKGRSYLRTRRMSLDTDICFENRVSQKERTLIKFYCNFSDFEWILVVVSNGNHNQEPSRIRWPIKTAKFPKTPGHQYFITLLILVSTSISSYILYPGIQPGLAWTSWTNFLDVCEMSLALWFFHPLNVLVTWRLLNVLGTSGFVEQNIWPFKPLAQSSGQVELYLGTHWFVKLRERWEVSDDGLPRCRWTPTAARSGLVTCWVAKKS